MYFFILFYFLILDENCVFLFLFNAQKKKKSKGSANLSAKKILPLIIHK
jgi:hypothetical protein